MDASDIKTLIAEVNKRVNSTLEHVRHAELAAARRDRARAPSGENRAGDAARREQLHPVPVEGMEHLELLPAGTVPESAVGEHPVDVEDHEAHAPGPFQGVGSGEWHAAAVR